MSLLFLSGYTVDLGLVSSQPALSVNDDEVQTNSTLKPEPCSQAPSMSQPNPMIRVDSPSLSAPLKAPTQAALAVAGDEVKLKPAGPNKRKPKKSPVVNTCKVPPSAPADASHDPHSSIPAPVTSHDIHQIVNAIKTLEEAIQLMSAKLERQEAVIDLCLNNESKHQ